jgi:hypothetical protein
VVQAEANRLRDAVAARDRHLDGLRAALGRVSVAVADAEAQARVHVQ